MANDNDSVDSNGNSTDLRPRRSNRAKGKPIQPLEETDENIIVHNNVVYKVGDFVYYLDKKQDIYRIGLIEEFKQQKRDKLVNKRPEISVKQFYRLDEIPSSVLSNHGEYDTHVMPPNFPEWLRQREIFISDNALSTSCSSLRSLCTVRHFPDLSHAMALFSTAQSSSQVANSSPRVDHHTLITGKDNGCIPIPKQRDDNTFFYVYSYNARGRKLAATYLEIRVGPAYQVELPELRSVDEQVNDPRFITGAWEQLIWKPNQIPEAVFGVYNMATISIACFSGFGGGVDDSASVENGRKIASHMLTCQKALDCLHKSQYNMEKAMEIFAENSLPETSKMPFLWTDEDHLLFDESVKIHGKNFLRIMQDKRNKKGRLVGDYVTFYYYWKKNRPKNRKYTTKKNLRSRNSNVALSEMDGTQEGDEASKQSQTISSTDNNGVSKPSEGENQSPSDASIECCTNCKVPLPKEEEVSLDSDKTVLSDRMKLLCISCQHYLRRYGYQKPLEIVQKIKCSDDGDFEEGVNGFYEEDDDEEGEEDEDDDVFQTQNSPPQNPGDKEDGASKTCSQSVAAGPGLADNKNTLAINKYDFDAEDDNVEEVSSLLKRNQAKYTQLREPEGVKPPANGASIFHILPTKGATKPPNTSSTVPANGQSTKTPVKPGEPKSNKRNSLLRKSSNDSFKKRKLDLADGTVSTRSSASVSGRNSLLNHPSVRNQIHDSLMSTLAQNHPQGAFGVKSGGGPIDPTEKNTSIHDSNSLTSSSSSTSNDSSNDSSEEGDNQPIASKKAVEAPKYPPAKLEPLKEPQVYPSTKDSADSSYNQMITSIPNIPGVCAVTNVGEPMPLLTQNLSTDLSASQPSAVSDLNILVAEPLYKQLSIRNPATTTTASHTPASTTTSPYDAIAALQRINKTAAPLPDLSTPMTIVQSFTPANVEPVAKFVNFNSISNQRVEIGNPEETGLNLVKPKKRMETSYNDSNWAPPHDSPSKLVHHRGDNSTGDSGIVDAPKQMINDHEVVHGSIYGHVIRVVKSNEDTCARTDLQHTTSSLKQADLEKKRAYINQIKMSEASGVVSQDSCRRADDPKKPGLMPPPIDKNPVHHSLSTSSSANSSSKSYSMAPLNTSQSQSSSNQPHARKVNSTNSGGSHGLRSPSPANAAAANSRSHGSFTSLPANMIRPNHMMNTSLHNAASNPRQNIYMNPNIQSVANSPLLNDYNNMNKVNMNELLFYQNPAQNYDELVKYQEIQKLLMMHSMGIPPARPMQWDQRFGSGADAWAGGGMGGPGGVVPMAGPGDMQSMMRAMGLPGLGPPPPPQQSIAQGGGRPRSATGLNLTNSGGVGQPGPGDTKPGSGRASVNQEYQRQLAAAAQEQQQVAQAQQMMAGESPEMMEAFRVLLADQMCQQMYAANNIQQKVAAATGAMQGPQTGQGHAPPMAHGLGGFGGGGAGGHMAGLALMSHLQALAAAGPSAPSSSGVPGQGNPPLKQGQPTPANNGGGGGPQNQGSQNPMQRQQHMTDVIQMLMGINRNAAR